MANVFGAIAGALGGAAQGALQAQEFNQNKKMRDIMAAAVYGYDPNTPGGATDAPKPPSTATAGTSTSPPPSDGQQRYPDAPTGQETQGSGPSLSPGPAPTAAPATAVGGVPDTRQAPQTLNDALSSGLTGATSQSKVIQAQRATKESGSTGLFGAPSTGIGASGIGKPQGAVSPLFAAGGGQGPQGVTLAQQSPARAAMAAALMGGAGGPPGASQSPGSPQGATGTQGSPQSATVGQSASPGGAPAGNGAPETSGQTPDLMGRLQQLYGPVMNAPRIGIPEGGSVMPQYAVQGRLAGLNAMSQALQMQNTQQFQHGENTANRTLTAAGQAEEARHDVATEAESTRSHTLEATERQQQFTVEMRHLDEQLAQFGVVTNMRVGQEFGNAVKPADTAMDQYRNFTTNMAQLRGDLAAGRAPNPTALAGAGTAFAGLTEGSPRISRFVMNQARQGQDLSWVGRGENAIEKGLTGSFTPQTLNGMESAARAVAQEKVEGYNANRGSFARFLPKEAQSLLPSAGEHYSDIIGKIAPKESDFPPSPQGYKDFMTATSAWQQQTQ